MKKKNYGIGPEFRKWCGIADEPKNSPRFYRLMRRLRRDRLGELEEQDQCIDTDG